MPVETEQLVPLREWFAGAALDWLVVMACVILIATLVAWVVGVLRSGPVRATKSTWRVLRDAVADLLLISPRRLLALSGLAVKESIRKWIVVVFIIFVLILLFAGWFIDPASRDPARLYLDLVLTATGYLTLLLALFLSAMSLPADIKNKTLHTVVTKPVRSSEIVLAHILGFTAVGTVLLILMGVISYVFVVRGLSHTHQLTAADLRPADRSTPANGRQPELLQGFTSAAHQHKHRVVVSSDGKQNRVEMAQGHWHQLTVEGAGKDAVYSLGPPQGMLQARVPIYGKLRFKNKTGQDAEKGVNVGDEWTYRTFIEGGNQAAAIWTFEGITEEKFPDGIPLEMTIEVFRTHKGDLEKGIPGSLWIRNPQSGKKVEVRIFEAKKFATDLQFIPRELNQKGRKLDLFRDLVSDDGRLEVWLQCLQVRQYFGMAQADLYLRVRPDVPFWWNFVKGYLGIWLQMVLVIGIGVMFSTFLSAPVALIATLGSLVGGLCLDFMREVASGKIIGGGPFESGIRILSQQNQTSQLPPGLQTTFAQMADRVAETVLWVISSLLPEFGRFDFANHVSYGFNISSDLLVQSFCRAAAFVVPLFVAGYIFLKTREVAR